MAEKPRPWVGQVWEDRDVRESGRRLRVAYFGFGYAYCVTVSPLSSPNPEPTE